MHRDPTYMEGSVKVECAQCGPYTISDAANSDFKRLGLHRGLISGTIRRRADSGTRVIINSEEMGQLALLPPLTFKERMEGYLLVATNQSAELGGYFAYGLPKLIAGSYCSSEDELDTQKIRPRPRSFSRLSRADRGPYRPARQHAGYGAVAVEQIAVRRSERQVLGRRMRRVPLRQGASHAGHGALQRSHI